ncbi:hypothetical protein WJX81_003792 [Elliptochloris bilobata]|uniref:Aldose 1-epimerase n=1 Tax=Elliptochloris bilobata TaxID=381761 RepID=A0AAW1QYX2_9CHLO
MGDIVLGFDSAEPYQDGTSPYFGAVIGRCANRIADGKFELEGIGGVRRTYQLATNNGPNHLHGGECGFNKVTWHTEKAYDGPGASVRLTYTSPDGDQGYPGTVEAAVTYTLSVEGDKTVLAATLEATADQPTIVSLTQHSYFNLAGHASSDVLGHELTLLGQHMTPVDATSIPTGEVAPVAGTRFDFTSPRCIGDGLGADGIDHNYVLHGLGADARDHVRAGTIGDTGSGRTLRLLTNAPGLQLYTGNFLGGERGKGGATYGKHAGVCLEPQAWPNAVNEPGFPSVVLRPGEKYRHRIVYEFSTWVAYPSLA